jgi:phosphoglycerate kinase
VALFNKKTVKDIDLKGKRVLLRADYNVPVENGVISDDYRIKQSLPTIKYILEQTGSSLVIVSHLGRPKGPDDKEFSLKPVAAHLAKLLGKEVKLAPDCIGDETKKMAAELKPGQILLFENVRFHPQEEKNDSAFAKAIFEASGAKIFVQDGFGVVHRAHATTDAITKLLPSVAGLLLAAEIKAITSVMEKPEHPLVAVIGGAKISDKIDFLNRLIDLADCVAVAGAMANDFLLAQGIKVGKSLVEPGVMDTAHEVLQRAHTVALKRPFSFLVPVDVVVSSEMDGTAPTRVVDLSSHSLADIEAYPKTPKPAAYTVGADEMILDIGPLSASRIAGVMAFAKTVIWNGPCGVTEVKGIAGAPSPYAHGTKLVVDAMIGSGSRDKNKPFSLVGGGDTAAYVETEGLLDDFNHVSTGGGASLDLMSGYKLPGVEALLNK